MKAAFTLDQHRQTGADLKRLRDNLLRLADFIDQTYPRRSRQARAANKAIQALNSLRAALDADLFQQHDGAAIDRASIYFGGTPGGTP